MKTRKKKKLFSAKSIRQLAVILVIVAIGAIGVKLLMQTHAASTPVSNTGVTPVYRFFRYAGGHFFTVSKAERDNVRTNIATGYRYEGVAFYAYTTQVSGSQPVYRLFDLLKGYHFYTINVNEYNQVRALTKYYRDEGVAYYAKPTSATATQPVYRLYDYRQGIHFYTVSLAEKNYLQTSVSNIYRYEGIAYYLPDPNGVPGTNAFYFSPSLGSYATGQTFTTTLRVNSAQSINAVQAWIDYDPTKLQFISIQNSAAFPVAAATQTNSGQLRIGRGTNSGTSVTGDQAVVTLTFKMLSTSSKATLSYEQGYNLLARASDSTDILGITGEADFWVE